MKRQHATHPPARLVYTLKEVAEVLGVSYKTAWRLADCGEIKSIRKTRTHLIPVKELESWVERSAI